MSDPSCPFCQKLTTFAVTPTSAASLADEPLWSFPHSIALLGPWQYYLGYCVLVSRRHARELFDLSDEERRAYLDEMTLLARAIHATFQPLKLNYELLGNQVPHLHWHLFPRYASDPARLSPVWLELDAAERDAELKQRLQTGPVSRPETIAGLRRTLTSLGATRA